MFNNDFVPRNFCTRKFIYYFQYCKYKIPKNNDAVTEKYVSYIKGIVQ